MQNNLVIGDIEIEDWSMIVLYEPDSGEIVQTHQCITIKGGKHPTKEQLDRDAREALRQLSRRVAVPRKLSALHLDPRGLDPESHYRVDPKKRVLVTTQMKKVIRRKKN